MVIRRDGRELFEAVEAFVLGKLEELNLGDPREILDKYREPVRRDENLSGMPRVMKGMLESWKNAQSKTNVIGSIDDLSDALNGFDPVKIMTRLEGTPEEEKHKELLEHISANTGKSCTPRTPRSHWPQFAKGIVSICRFLEAFDDDKAFHDWVNAFDRSDETRPALPLVLSQEIHGFGFALACDFLKELGYSGYGKPDIHVRDILIELRYCHHAESDFMVFKRIVDLAGQAGVSPYELDKLLWLTGSGWFYQHDKSGKLCQPGKTLPKKESLRIGSSGENKALKSEFNEYCKSKHPDTFGD